MSSLSRRPPTWTYPAPSVALLPGGSFQTCPSIRCRRLMEPCYGLTRASTLHFDCLWPTRRHQYTRTACSSRPILSFSWIYHGELIHIRRRTVARARGPDAKLRCDIPAQIDSNWSYCQIPIALVLLRVRFLLLSLEHRHCPPRVNSRVQGTVFGPLLEVRIAMSHLRSRTKRRAHGSRPSLPQRGTKTDEKLYPIPCGSTQCSPRGQVASSPSQIRSAKRSLSRSHT